MTTALRWCVLAFLAVPLLATAALDPAGKRLLEETAAIILSSAGYQSKVALGDSITRLVQESVIEPEKFEAIYTQRSGIPKELKDVLSEPSYRPILLTRKNAAVYVNLLWPLGLANRMAANRDSPLNGPSRPEYASTGGWKLGSETNGGAYFNRFSIVPLTAHQEALVVKVARHSFRPCCDNSTFFQDCNHGSALLGLLALGAAQGLTEKELYREALAFNAFWFPNNYVHTALYFKAVRKIQWQDIDARKVMSAGYSSASGWQKNVAAELVRLGLLPAQGGANCGV